MTVPEERLNALLKAKRFLMNLLDPKKTPKVPLDVRREARRALKHYPATYELEKIRQKAPEELGTEELDLDND